MELCSWSSNRYVMEHEALQVQFSRQTSYFKKQQNIKKSITEEGSAMYLNGIRTADL
jgi:hypothetical protein